MKRERHAAILDLVRTHRVSSQEELRRLLRRRGIRVTQATLSRDLRELQIVKIPDAEGRAHYQVAPDAEPLSPALDRLLPHLLLEIDGVGNLLVVKTLRGGAQPVGEAIDWEEWPEVVGSVAGDDTVLLVLRRARDRTTVARRLLEAARRPAR
jgi:transcriptional regulator of arginine metabolism